MTHNATKEGNSLKRALSYKDLVFYGMVFMVVIAPMSIFGFVSREGHGMAPLVYLVGVICMLFTALSYRKMSAEFPIAGSVYTYVQKSINPHVGFLAGWLILLDYVFAPALLYALTASWCVALMPGTPFWLWVVVFVALNTLINVRGIEYTAKMDVFIFTVSALALALFLYYGITYVADGGGTGSFTLAPFYQPNTINPAFIGTAVTIAALSFLGFDGISTLAEEAREPRRDVGRAIITALLVIGALFILQSYIATLIQPDFTKMDENNAFFDAALLAGGPFLKTVLLVVNILAIGIANTMAAQAAASRVLFGMARDKFLPKALSRVHAKYQTPHISTLFMAALSLIVALLTSIDFLTKLINFGALTSFIILNFSVFWLFFVKKQQRSGLHLLNHLVYPWLGMLILAYVWINFDKATLTIGFIWLGCGIVLGFFKTKGYKELPSVQFG